MSPELLGVSVLALVLVIGVLYGVVRLAVRHGRRDKVRKN